MLELSNFFEANLWTIICVFFIICVAIISGGYFSYYKYIRPILKSLTDINNNLSNLNDISQHQDGNKHQVEQLANILNNNLLTKKYYKHFYASCIQKDNKIFATHKIENYFNLNNFVPKKKYYEDFSSYFTGLGLLFTFIAIALGLSHLHLESNDTNAIQNGIGGLINGLSAKFLSSISGIGCSLFYSFLFGIVINTINKQIDKLNEKVNEIFEFKYSELILYDIRDATEQQTENLKEFLMTNDFSDAIRQAIDDSNEKSVVPVLNDIKEILSRSDTSRVFEAIELFINQIDEKMGDVNSQQSEVLLQSIQEVQKQSKQFIQDITNTLLGKTEDINQQFIIHQNKIVSKQAESQHIIEQNINNMINQISNNSNNVLEEINNKFSHITTALINTQTDAINNLEKNTQHNQNHIDVIQNKLAETMNHFEKYINNNVTTTQQLNNAVANILTKYEESIKANQEQLQQTNETLSNITKSMVEFNNIASTMNKSASAIGSSANILKDTNTTIKQQNELFSQGVDTLQYSLQSKIDNWNDYINRTGETEAKINDLVKLLNETISAYTIKHADINTNFMKQFSEQIQKIANSTNSAIESIEEFTERCGDLLNKR